MKKYIFLTSVFLFSSIGRCLSNRNDFEVEKFRENSRQWLREKRGSDANYPRRHFRNQAMSRLALQFSVESDHQYTTSTRYVFDRQALMEFVLESCNPYTKNILIKKTSAKGGQEIQILSEEVSGGKSLDPIDSPGDQDVDDFFDSGSGRPNSKDVDSNFRFFSNYYSCSETGYDQISCDRISKGKINECKDNLTNCISVKMSNLQFSCFENIKFIWNQRQNIHMEFYDRLILSYGKCGKKGYSCKAEESNKDKSENESGNGNSHNSNMPIIAGSVTLAAVIICVIVIVVILKKRRKSNPKENIDKSGDFKKRNEIEDTIDEKGKEIDDELYVEIDKKPELPEARENSPTSYSTLEEVREMNYENDYKPLRLQATDPKSRPPMTVPRPDDKSEQAPEVSLPYYSKAKNDADNNDEDNTGYLKLYDENSTSKDNIK